MPTGTPRQHPYQCPHCGASEPDVAFYRSHGQRSHASSWCIPCSNDRATRLARTRRSTGEIARFYLNREQIDYLKGLLEDRDDEMAYLIWYKLLTVQEKADVGGQD